MRARRSLLTRKGTKRSRGRRYVKHLEYQLNRERQELAALSYTVRGPNLVHLLLQAPLLASGMPAERLKLGNEPLKIVVARSLFGAAGVVGPLGVARVADADSVAVDVVADHAGSPDALSPHRDFLVGSGIRDWPGISTGDFDRIVFF